jgi:hypothetical protein
MEEREAELLPVPYVIFTLVIYDLVFKASAETMLPIAPANKCGHGSCRHPLARQGRTHPR